ncbi:hypothetical protein LINPERHAP1_LOCUS38728, partial [Linum perenne]
FGRRRGSRWWESLEEGKEEKSQPSHRFRESRKKIHPVPPNPNQTPRQKIASYHSRKSSSINTQPAKTLINKRSKMSFGDPMIE